MIIQVLEVSTWRRRPRVGTIRGGGTEETGRRESVGCAQASQGGFWLRAAKGLGGRLRFGGGGAGVIGHVSAAALGHTQWSMRHSHTRAISPSWQKKRAETMEKPTHTGREMRAGHHTSDVR